MHYDEREMIVQDQSAGFYKNVRYGSPNSHLYNEWRMSKQ